MQVNVEYKPQFEAVRSYCYEGTEPGPHLLFLGGVHGNEVCGQRALSALKDELESGSLHIQKGKLTIVPYANPWACASFKRYMEKNLNRVIGHHENPQAYEERLACQIAKLIDDCDVLVDLHSISSYCPAPFVFNDFPKPENDKLCHAVGGHFIVKNWQEMFTEHPGHEVCGTQLYAEKAGKTGCLIECGQHEDDRAIDVAARAVRNAMKLYGLIPGEPVIPEFKGEIIGKKAFVKRGEGKMTSTDWHHLKSVEKGTVIAEYDNGEKLAVPEDGYLLLPYHGAQIGDEWFYFGQLLKK